MGGSIPSAQELPGAWPPSLFSTPKWTACYYWLFINEAGEEKPHYGRFTIVDRPSKVQYTWMSLHTRGLESLVTVTFRNRARTPS